MSASSVGRTRGSASNSSTSVPASHRLKRSRLPRRRRRQPPARPAARVAPKPPPYRSPCPRNSLLATLAAPNRAPARSRGLIRGTVDQHAAAAGQRPGALDRSIPFFENNPLTPPVRVETTCRDAPSRSEVDRRGATVIPNRWRHGSRRGVGGPQHRFGRDARVVQAAPAESCPSRPPSSGSRVAPPGSPSRIRPGRSRSRCSHRSGEGGGDVTATVGSPGGVCAMWSLLVGLRCGSQGSGCAGA